MSGTGSEESASSQAQEREADELARQAEEHADELERRSDKLHDEVSAVREDWRRKRADSNVPGAPAPDERAEPDQTPAPEAPPEDAG